MAAETKLKSGAVTMLGAATLGAVMMAPALGIYGNYGPMVQAAGKIAPAIFLIALIASLPTAASYALVSRELPSSGSAYTWLWKATTPTLGLGVGVMMAVYYVVAVLLQPIMFGLFFNNLLSFVGLQGTGYLTWVIGILVVTVVVALLTYRGIKISTGSALIFMVIESLVVLALAVTILVVKGSHGGLDFSPFNPGDATNGTKGLFAGLIMGLLSFTGFDVASTVSEETQSPRRNIPRATMLSILVVGVFWVLTSWGMSIAVPPSAVAHLVNYGVTPVTPIAHIYWGAGDILVILTGLTAATGVYVATVVGASRVLYAMGRERTMPAGLGKLHPKFQTPWNAMHLIFPVTIVLDLIFGAWVGQYNAFAWWGSAIVFFALVTYMFVNLANLVFFLRYRRDKFNWFLNGVVPVVGIVIDVYLLYSSFFVSLWSSGFAMGQSIVLLAVLVLLAVVVYTFVVKARNPQVLVQETQTLES